MASQNVLKQFQKAVSLWPKDALRPHANFADVLAKRAAKNAPTELETNAVFSLLENRYARQYPLSSSTWKPASNPQYYDNLVEEMKEAPKRGWLARYINSWKGAVRWK